MIGIVAVDIAANATYPDAASQGGMLSLTNTSLRSLSSSDSIESSSSSSGEQTKSQVNGWYCSEELEKDN